MSHPDNHHEQDIHRSRSVAQHTEPDPSAAHAADVIIEESNPWDDRPAGLLRNLHLYAAMLATVGLIFFVAIQVVLRTVFYYPLSWPPELARYLHIWVVFLGITVVLRYEGHVRVDYFLLKMPPRLRWLFEILADVCSVALAVIVAIGSYIVLGDVAGQVTPALRMPVSLFFAVTLIGFVLFTLALLVRITNRVRTGPVTSPQSSFPPTTSQNTPSPKSGSEKGD